MKKFSKKELIVFIILFVLGAFLRLYKLDIYPAGFHGDEAWTGLEARRILREGFIGFWSPAALGQTALPFYWTAIFSKLFGESISVIRTSFSLLNIFWIPFFYLFIRAISSSKIASVSTFLLVTNNTALAISRRADYVAANFPLFPSLFFCWLAFKTNKAIYFIISGIMIGLLNHSYFAFWIVPFLLFFYGLSILAFDRNRKEIILKCWKNVFLLFFFYLLVIFPIVKIALGHPNDFLSRTRTVSILNQKTTSLSQNIKLTLLIFNLEGDQDIWSNFSHTPIFNPLLGLLFLIGLIGLVTYSKKEVKKYLLCYLLFFSFLLANTFTNDAPNIRRIQVSIFIAFYFTAIGFETVSLYLNKLLPKFRNGFSAFLILLIVTAGAKSTSSYFSKYSVSEETKYILCYQLTKIADFVTTLPKNSHIYFFSDRWSIKYETNRYLLANYSGEDRSEAFGRFSLVDLAKEQNVVYIFLPEYFDNLEKVEKLYPEGKKFIMEENNKILFGAYFIQKIPVNLSLINSRSLSYNDYHVYRLY